MSPESLQRSRNIGALLARLLDLYCFEPGFAPSYLEALTIHDLDSGCMFAPTEVSLSFAPGRRPTVRCLAEIVNACSPLSPQTTVAKVGDHLIAGLARNSGAYDHALFRDLTTAAYPKTREGHRALRFGAALEWPTDPHPGLKCYFDLHADPRKLAPGRLEASFRRLDLEPHFQRAKELLGHRFDEGKCRGMGTDFGTSGVRGIRLYMSGAYWSLKELRQLLIETGRQELIPLLDIYNRAVLGRLRADEAINHLLVSLVFTSLTGKNPILKLDAFMPGLKPDDLASYEAFCSLARNLKISNEDYADAFGVLSDSDSLSDSQAILQYLSLDFLPAPQAKLNVYFRLPGTETEHMGPRVQPRSKPQILRLLDASCRRAIAALERERVTQYSEALHRMVFPRAAGFSSAQEVHLGDVFQRALIIDTLLDAEKTGFLIDAGGLDDDIARLVEMRSSDGLRGWKYFPSLPELPPDVDDLAQVIQVLQRVEHPALNEMVPPLLQVIEESNQNTDGSFETWIVDLRDESPASVLIKKFIREHWGSGPNPEVMANLLYAMWCYDAERYRRRIDGALRYLASRQLPDGSWPADWYAGLAYSTFVCVRALRAADSSHYALHRATRFLLDTQHAVGGWGPGAPNNGDTAYALRTACLLSNEMTQRVIMPGCRFLLQQQEADGFWAASDFITMNTSRARNVSEGKGLVYRSKTLTTAACLSALCAVRRIGDLD